MLNPIACDSVYAPDSLAVKCFVVDPEIGVPVGPTVGPTVAVGVGTGEGVRVGVGVAMGVGDGLTVGPGVVTTPEQAAAIL